MVNHDISNILYRHTGSSGRTGSYQINGLNQYIGIAGQAIAHDANGNMILEGGTNYTYDSENRLTRVVSPSHTATLEYDPKGRLTKYTVQGVATHLIYDGDNLILEIKNGSITNRYVHTGNMGTPAVSYTGSAVGTANRQFLHKNHQGSVIAATDNSGNASYINTYDAYGVPGNNNQGRFAYTGQLYLAELGLYHYRARTYAPKLGRFLQTDPIGYEDQMNLYAYVGNDPMNFTDPTGMQTFYGCTPSGAASWSCGGNSGSNDNAKDDSAAQEKAKVIDTTFEALDHYLNGDGESVELGPNTKSALREHPLVQRQSGALKNGSANHVNGNLSVELRGDVYHVGRTRIDFSTVCDAGSCTTVYTGFSGDGFWDPIAPAGFGDGIGGSWEIPGGNGYYYKPYMWSETYGGRH